MSPLKAKVWSFVQLHLLNDREIAGGYGAGMINHRGRWIGFGFLVAAREFECVNRWEASRKQRNSTRLEDELDAGRAGVTGENNTGVSECALKRFAVNWGQTV